MDLRERVIAAYDSGDGSSRQLAEAFGKSASWIRELLRLRRERGSIAAVEYTPSTKPKLSAERLARVCQLVAEESDLTAEEGRRRLRLLLSISRVSALLPEEGFTRKRSSSCRPSKGDPTCSGRNGLIHDVWQYECVRTWLRAIRRLLIQTVASRLEIGASEVKSWGDLASKRCRWLSTQAARNTHAQ